MPKREKVDLVDENDVVIGQKWRDELLPTDRIRIIGIWLVNSHAEVLIAQRSQEKVIDPGIWGPSAAGTVPAGSTYIETAQRELSEELGVNVILDEVARGAYGTKDSNLRFITWFRADLNKPAPDFILQQEEVADIKWVRIDNLIKSIKDEPQLYPADAGTWIDVLKSLRGDW